jgi:hypothetical protein
MPKDKLNNMPRHKLPKMINLPAHSAGYFQKLVFAAALLCLLVWLAVTGSSKDGRIVALNEALASKRIGRIGERDRQSLQQTVAEMIKANGISTDIAVNQRYDPSRLNIYVTSSAAERITNCGPGNAIYDTDLDTIFIDEQFFSTDGFRNIVDASGYTAVAGFREDLEFPKIYTRFVLLHELGHRQLHRHVSFYDRVLGTTAIDAREREADRFAIRAMETFYAFDRTHEHLVGDPQLDLIGGSITLGPAIPPQAQVFADLAGTLFVMSVFNLHLNTPYSPFFQDKLHPTFLDRAQGAIAAMLERSELNDDLKGNLAALRASLAREASVGKLSFKEVLVPGPISDVGFGSDGLFALGLRSNVLFSVSQSELSDDSARVVAAKRFSEMPASDSTNRSEGFWIRPNGTIVLVDGNGHSWIFNKGTSASYSFQLPTPFTTSTCFRTVLPPQPSEFAVATACDESGGSWMLSFQNDSLIAKRSFASLLSEIVTKGGGSPKELEISAVDENNLYLAVLNGDSKPRLLMRATVSIASLAITEIGTFPSSSAILDKDNQSDRRWPLLISTANGHPKDVLLAQSTGHDPVFAAWALSNQREPQLIKSQNFFVDEIRAQASGDLIANFDPAVGGVWWLSPTKSLAYYDSDSVYLFDFASEGFRVVFHPTFEGIEIRIGSGGRWALFMRGGSRIFVFSE